MARIAFVSTLDGVPWGGSEALWSQAAVELHRRSHQVKASVHWWSETPQPVQQLQQKGIEVEQRRIRVRTRLLLGKRAEQKVFQWLDQHRPDLVVLSLESQSAGFNWMQACRERGLKYAVIVQAVIEHLWPGDAVNLELSRGYQNAEAIYYLSKLNLEWLQTQFAHELPRSIPVFNPFNVSPEAVLPWPTGKQALRLAYVGRLEPIAKGHDLLFNVLRQPKWKARSLEVSLFGSGPYEQSLRALSTHYGLSNVHFAGFNNDVESIWREHHALILPSRFEGLPLTVVEAMLCGRACIVTDVAGNAELLEDNVSGFVAAAPKAEFLDEALERAWNAWQQNKLQEVGQVAAQQIRKQIPLNPVQIFADQIEALL